MPIESQETALSRLPDVELPDLSGTVVSLPAYAAGRACVVAFTCNHCPYVQSIETALGEISRDRKYIAWLAICSNDATSYPEDDVPGLLAQVQRADWRFPYLVDATQQVARTFGAVCTPDFFVFDTAGALVYRGAMDDARPRQPQPIDGRHLLEALDAAVSNRTYSAGRPSMGCGIKWKDGS
jgi:peroxiredoxin